VRRGIRVASFVVIYCAGIASMDLWSRFGRNDLGARPSRVANVSHTSADSTIKVAPSPAAMQSATDQSHSQMRPKTEFESMRDAADRVWETSGDIALAARLYGRAVRNASSTELAVSGRDNLLLSSLKEARIQEMKHVQADL
jgi:hypothetical protein